MEFSVRAFVLDADDNILLVKHAANQMWTIPGGHMEEGETPYESITRELNEEMGIDITVIGSDTLFTNHEMVSMPLPISIHKIRYDHRNRGEVEKFEYIFFARTDDDIQGTDTEEIFDFQWFTVEDIFAMDTREFHTWMKELLEQNEDLLTLL